MSRDQTPSQFAAMRCQQIADDMGVMLPAPLSRQATREAPFHSDVIERFPRTLSHMRSSQAQFLDLDRENAPATLGERVALRVSIVVFVGMMVYLAAQALGLT